MIARLRGLTLMSVLAMLGVALGLIWSGYQQRLADRQAAVKQAVEMAHARIQLAYAQQQFGRLDVVHAQKQALAALDKLGLDAADYLWVNDAGRHTLRAAAKSALIPASVAASNMSPYVKGFEPWGWVIGVGLYIDDLQSALLTQTALTMGAVLLMALILWGLLEATARELKASAKAAAVKARPAARGPLAYAQGEAAPAHAMGRAPFDEATSGEDVQEVKRLRMAGAI
ncbi:MAG: cache domain-containing protein [Aquabacterium sp.]